MKKSSWLVQPYSFRRRTFAAAWSARLFSSPPVGERVRVRGCWPSGWFVALGIFLAGFAALPGLGQVDFQRLKSFGDPNLTGQNPIAGLIEGSDGALYGTTPDGGSGGEGTVYKLNRDGSGCTVLWGFSSGGGDGSTPHGGLVEGGDGALYGTTLLGGSGYGGTVFKLDRDGSGYTVLRTFTASGSDAYYPRAGLIEGSDGALYGTTLLGGSGYGGTVFKLNRDGSGYTVLWSFSSGGGDGYYPIAGLIEGSDGALYGTTHSGGSGGLGTVFRLNADGSGYAVLWSFSSSGGDGYYPIAGLIEGSDGALYGTTGSGGSGGTVFRLNRDGSGYAVLRSFSSSGGDGYYPYAGLIESSDGALYGTTMRGGSGGGGTVFKLNRDGSGYTVLWSFSDSGGWRDGYTPYAGLIEGSDGAMYGTTAHGGDASRGIVFRLSFNQDITAPVLTLLGENPMTIIESQIPFVDPGATATDDLAGDLTSAIQISGSVNPAVAGTYILSYTVSDPSGNTSSATRTVIVITASQATSNLAELLSNANLPASVTGELSASLNAAIASFERGNETAGVNQLQAFQNKVLAQAGKKIDPATADALLAATQQIIDAVTAP